MYSGNIGLYYDLENIIKVIGEFKNYEDIVFAFVGDGTVKNQIQEYSIKNQLSNVTFIPYQKKEDLIYSLNAADVHLVTNQKGIKGVSVPSKVYGVMATGKAILGVLEKGSEAELLISNSQCGLTVEPQDYDEIKRAIESLLQQKQEMAQIGIRGRAYLDQYLKKEISCGLTVEPQDYDEIKRAIESLLQQKQEMAQIGIRGRAYLDQYLKKEISVNKYAETLKSLA